MKRARSITADEIIRGAIGKRPKVRFPGLSRDLEQQASSLVVKHEATHIRRGASPFVESILAKKWRRP